jgi:hypothetical protein
MPRMLRLALLLLLTLPMAQPLRAQAAPEAQVREVIDRLFDGMRRGDSTAVRSVFHPEARMLSTMLQNGNPAMQAGDVDEFVRAVGSPHAEVWDERIDDLEIRVDDPMATAWMTYRFHLGDAFSHCGVNAFDLVRGAEGWRVVQVMDTRRRSCPD